MRKHFVFTKAVKVIASMCLMALVGCASSGKNRPSCDMPDGISCLSTLKVYEITNDQISVTNGAIKTVDSLDIQRYHGDADRGNPGATTVHGDTISLAGDVGYERGVNRIHHGGSAVSEPFRVPAKVMRIYLSAWQDEAGDLHMPGFIFQEIEARKWSTGLPVHGVDSNSFRLLEGLRTSAAQDAQETADAEAVGGRSNANGNQ